MTENAYRKVTEDELEYERRESRFRYQLQRNTELSVARSEGLAEGAAQKQREIAKVMKEKSISNTEISEITGLSVEEVDKL